MRMQIDRVFDRLLMMLIGANAVLVPVADRSADVRTMQYFTLGSMIVLGIGYFTLRAFNSSMRSQSHG